MAGGCVAGSLQRPAQEPLRWVSMRAQTICACILIDLMSLDTTCTRFPSQQAHQAPTRCTAAPAIHMDERCKVDERCSTASTQPCKLLQTAQHMYTTHSRQHRAMDKLPNTAGPSGTHTLHRCTYLPSIWMKGARWMKGAAPPGGPPWWLGTAASELQCCETH